MAPGLDVCTCFHSYVPQYDRRRAREGQQLKSGNRRCFHPCAITRLITGRRVCAEGGALLRSACFRAILGANTAYFLSPPQQGRPRRHQRTNFFLLRLAVIATIAPTSEEG